MSNVNRLGAVKPYILRSSLPFWSDEYLPINVTTHRGHGTAVIGLLGSMTHPCLSVAGQTHKPQTPFCLNQFSGYK